MARRLKAKYRGVCKCGCDTGYGVGSEITRCKHHGWVLAGHEVPDRRTLTGSEMRAIREARKQLSLFD